MKKTCFFSLLLLSIFSFAQDSTKKVNADDNLLQVFKIQDLYHYPAFKNGRVIFRDGSEVNARLNYNKLFEQFIYIDDKGDSMAIGNPELIRLIVIEKDSFHVVNTTYIRALGWYGPIQLAGKQTLKEVDEEKTGAYGQKYSNNATTSKRFYFTVDGQPRLNVGEKMVFAKQNEFFFAYKSEDFLPCTKKNIEKVFSPHSKEIRDFMKEHHTDLANQASVRELIDFIGRL